MKPSSAGFHAHAASRLVAFPTPPCDEAREVLRALRSGRPSDARRYAGRIPANTKMLQIWRPYLESRIQLEEGAFADAGAAARRAASEALTLGLCEPVDQTALLLAGAALEAQGLALRRQDRCAEAGRIHLAALELRREHGTRAEQLESMLSLAACAEWNGDAARADTWFRTSLEVEDADANALLLKASLLIRYSNFLTASARHEEAISMARRAQALLEQRMPGDLITAVAGLTTASAMIRQLESDSMKSDSKSAELHPSVSAFVATLAENLAAFGPTACAELAWCEEQAQLLAQLRLAFQVDETESQSA